MTDRPDQDPGSAVTPPDAEETTFGGRVWGLIGHSALPVLIGLPIAAGFADADVETARQVAWYETILVFAVLPLLIPVWCGAFALAMGILGALDWSENDRIGLVRRIVLTVIALPITVLIIWLLSFLPGGSDPEYRDHCEGGQVIAC